MGLLYGCTHAVTVAAKGIADVIKIVEGPMSTTMLPTSCCLCLPTNNSLETADQGFAHSTTT